jgi:hypothetical protein
VSEDAGAPPSEWARRLPELEPAAVRGPAGAWACAVAGVYSEASFVGTLVGWLVAFGIALNRAAYLQPGATRHFGAEYALLVGPSNTGRKSEAIALALLPLRQAEEGFSDRILNGFGSGEVVVREIRDPRRALIDGEERLVDEGVGDKRLLICETEFATVLVVAGRENSTLSQNLRAAWDGARLSNRTKSEALVATDPHVGVLGAITPGELRRGMSTDAIANGFANRFLHVAVYRSTIEPELPPIPRELLSKHATELALALSTGRKRGQSHIDRSPEAAARWAQAYREELSIDRFGLAGEACARAEAHTLRLSLLYALADRAERIEVEHVEAALALWRYCEKSARLVYGRRLGIADADRLLDAIEQAGADGLSRSEIHVRVFARHGGAERVDAAIGPLLAAGLIVEASIPTAGRPMTRYIEANGKVA